MSDEDPRELARAAIAHAEKMDSAIRRKAGKAPPAPEPTASDPESFPMDTEGQAALVAAQEELVTGALQAAAKRRGLAHPEVVHKLVPWSELEFAEDGTPSNIGQVLDELVATYPKLAATGRTIDAAIRGKAGR